jgi:hypothetical protein
MLAADSQVLSLLVVCTCAGCVTALTLTLTAVGGETLGPFRLSRAPQPCFGAGSCELFEVSEAATTASKLGALQQAKVRSRLVSPCLITGR